jgi:hypothetical protein
LIKQVTSVLKTQHQVSKFFWQFVELNPGVDLDKDFDGTMMIQSNTTLALVRPNTTGEGIQRSSVEGASAGDR